MLARCPETVVVVSPVLAFHLSPFSSAVPDLSAQQYIGLHANMKVCVSKVTGSACWSSCVTYDAHMHHCVCIISLHKAFSWQILHWT